MSTLRLFFPAIRLATCCLVLAMGLRTWLVMGLIEPVTVTGSSMVPTLMGVSVVTQCPECHHQFHVGAEFVTAASGVACPQCDRTEIPLAGLGLQGSDRLWIDRTSMNWSRPQRWDVVVARNPEDAAVLCVKRIVALPGEQVSLQNGNVLIDNEVVTKSLSERCALRQRVHREQAKSKRWQPVEATRWVFEEGTWVHAHSPEETVDWLHYLHPRQQFVSDDVVYNAGVTRKLNPVNELMLTADIKFAGEGLLSFVIDDGNASAQLTLDFSAGSLSVGAGKRQGPTVQLSSRSRERLARGQVNIEFSIFDQELLFVIDGHVELRRPWTRSKPAGTTQPFSIGAQGLEVQIREATLYRDIYYSDQAVGIAPSHQTRWQLGPDEYFLLGDNPPISVDSRAWGPVSGSLFLGKPLFLER